MCEIEKLMGAAESSYNYRIINLGGNKLYIEGIKSVINLGETELVFQMKKQIISVVGSEFKIKYLDKNTCFLEGNILSVEQKWNSN